MILLKRFITSFLGLNEKKQQAKTEEVAAYVHDKKNTYTSEMIKIQSQARKLHTKTRQAHEESVKLNNMVDDIVYKVAQATGGIERTIKAKI